MELDEFHYVAFCLLFSTGAGPIGLTLQTRRDLGPSQSLGEI